MKIMIVDDSTYMCLFCRQILTEAGYEVVGEAHDGVSATSQAMVLEPDVILMDMALPKKNGMEAAELILQNQANVKIIAMSAIEEDWIGQKAIESGCVAFLPKPFDHIALLSYIREVETSESEVKYG